MALDVRNIYSILAGATAANANSGGFNPFNANFPTDLATTTGTNAAPTVSGAYAFTAADVTAGAWIYIAAGTNWIQGFYQITSQSGGVATLNAAIGSAVVWDASQGRWKPSTAQGCCTQNTPGGNATYGVDYSQSSGPAQTSTTVVSDAATPSVLTLGGLTYGTNLRGNLIHLKAGTTITQGWYEIVNTSGSSITLDRSCGAGVLITDLSIGGAFSLNSATTNQTDDAVFELGSGTNGTGSSVFFLKGSLTLGGTVAIAASGGTQAPVRVIGYGTVRGDAPTGTSRPSVAHAGFAMTLGTNWDERNVIHSGVLAGTLLTQGTNGKLNNCKVTNSTTSADRAALASGTESEAFDCELVSYRGRGLLAAAQNSLNGSYIHDCNAGIFDNTTTAASTYSFNVIESCVNVAINMSGAKTRRALITNNTLYGSKNTTGTGILMATGTTNVTVRNNIIAYFTTGLVHPDMQTVGWDDYNDWFGNDVDVAATAGGASDPTRWQKGPHDIAVDPQFTVDQATGATATTTSGNHLVQSGATFITSGVVAGRDYVYVVSGTGVTTGVYGIASVDSETQITTDITLTANATADKVFQITTGRNFAVAA